MADKKISALNPSTTPLTGAEVLPIVQSGATVKVSVADLTAGRAVAATSITTGLGAVGTPAYTFSGDTNTGIYSPTADTIAFVEGGVESMRIDSSGNVGIGTSAPGARLDARSASIADGTNGGIVNVYSTTAQAANVGGKLDFGGLYNGSNSLSFASVAGRKENSTSGDWSGYMQFSTRRFGGDFAERMRIDSSGNLLVGTTSFTAGANGMQIRSFGQVDISRDTTATADQMTFSNPNGKVGSISTSGSLTSFNVTSDARLKHDIVDAPEASNLIDAIQVRSFKWKADGSHQRYGFVAQELVTVAPEAVSQPADPDDMMGVDYSKLVPMLVKELQSVRARLAELEGK